MVNDLLIEPFANSDSVVANQALVSNSRKKQYCHRVMIEIFLERPNSALSEQSSRC